MWRGAHMRQNRWFDFAEEENKVKRNISKLFHTVQHIPSARSRLDTNSLWNLVGELESFNPAVASTKSMQFTHSVENKTFSRKYLNLRLYPSRDRTNTSPTQNRTCKKPQSYDSKEQKDDTGTNNKFKRCKRKFASKQNMDSNGGGLPAANKTQEKRATGNNKSDRAKNCRKKDNFDNDFEKSTKARKEKPVTKKSKTKFKSESSYSLTGKDLSGNEKFYLVNGKHSSSSPNKSTSDNVVSSNSRETNYFNQKRYNKHKNLNKCQVLGKIQNFNNDSHYKNNIRHESNLKTTSPIKNTAHDNSLLLSDEQSSTVKTLTNYWNNLLSNEFEECNIDSDDPGIQFYSVKSLEQLAQEMHHKIGKKRLLKNSTTMNSRHMSESNINILKRLDNLNSYTSTPKQYSNEIYGSSCEIQSPSRANSPEIVGNSRPEDGSSTLSRCFNVESSEPENISLDSISVKQSTENVGSLNSVKLDSVNKKTFTRHLDTNCHVSTENAIEVMLKLIRKLQVSPNSLLLEDEIRLPQSIKIMLSLMTSKVLSSQEEIFGEEFGISMTQVNQEKNDDSLYKSELQIIQSQISITPRKSFEETRSSETLSCGPGSNENLSLTDLLNHNCDEMSTNKQNNVIVVPVISLKTVEHALKFFALCKENLWMRFVFNPIPYGNSTFEGSNDECPLRSFTFVYEGKIVLEEDNENDQYFDGEEDEDETFWEFCRNSVISIANCVESLCEFALEHVLFYWPVSPEEFVRVVYQVSASFLIWWVIIKEMFK